MALMNVDLPAPGTPLMPTRTAPPVASAIEASSSAALLAVVGAGRLEQGDRPRHVLARARAHPGGEVRDVDLPHSSRSRRSSTRSTAARLMTVPGG